MLLDVLFYVSCNFLYEVSIFGKKKKLTTNRNMIGDQSAFTDFAEIQFRVLIEWSDNSYSIRIDDSIYWFYYTGRYADLGPTFIHLLLYFGNYYIRYCC